MLQTKKPLYKAVVVFNLLCIVFCLVAAALSMFVENPGKAFTLDAVFIILAMLAAAYYMLGGYSKNAAKYYKVFAAFAALSGLVTLISSCVSGIGALFVIIDAIVFAIILYMTFSLNQGKKRSYVFCGIAVALRVIGLVAFLIVGNATGVVVTRYVSYIILACLLGIMTFAKYVDKDARGTI